MSAITLMLEKDWDTLLEAQKWAELAQCLRSMVKLYKSGGQLQARTRDIESRLAVLEANLNSVDPKARFSIVGHIIFARRAIDSSSTTDYGGAFRRGKN